MDRPAEGNAFGIGEAVVGLLAGFLLSLVALSVYDSVTHARAGQESYGATALSLFALWAGLLGAVILASRLHDSRSGEGAHRPVVRAAVEDYGLRARLWPDVPLGLAVGVAAQLFLVPLLELPLLPFVPDLYHKLSRPAHSLLGPASSSGEAALVFISLLICVGSPFVEEMFFRGLLLRGLLGRLRGLGPRLGPAISIVVSGLFFALVHFEPLQFLGLAGFGVVLGLLAWRTGRLGPSMVAHMAFNTTTVIAYVLVR